MNDIEKFGQEVNKAQSAFQSELDNAAHRPLWVKIAMTVFVVALVAVATYIAS